MGNDGNGRCASAKRSGRFFRQRSAQAKYGGRFVYPEVEQGRLFGFLREVFQSEFHLDLYYGYTGFPINRSRAFNVENDPGCKRGRHCDRHFSVLVRLGAPTVSFAPDTTLYWTIHHSADDAFDKVDPAKLSQSVAVWSAFLFTVADSDIDFRKLAAEAP